VILCDFVYLTIGDQNEYDNGQRLFYLGVWESRWADPDPVRILKCLTTLVFRKKWPIPTPTPDSRQTGLLCKNASIERFRSGHLTELAWANSSWWANEACYIKWLEMRLGTWVVVQMDLCSSSTAMHKSQVTSKNSSKQSSVRFVEDKNNTLSLRSSHRKSRWIQSHTQ
jgi:hypothetical protein